jgi:hypothetical protein
MAGKSRTIGWIAGTVVVILAIAAANYFLLYQPRMDDAAATREEAEVVRSQNDLLRLQIASLAADYDRLDEYKAELAALAEQLPADRDWDTVLEMINAFATESGLALPTLEASVSAATPLTVFQSPDAAPAPAPTDGTGDGSEGTEGEDGSATDGSQPQAPALAAIDGLSMVPFSVKVAGPHANVMTFLDMLQQHDGRLFFVADFDLVRQVATEATELRPAVADGDVELTARGFFFALAPTTPAEPADSGTTAPLPSSGGANPFVPLEPTN